MSRQSACPVLNETDLDPVIATSTGTTHTLTVTVQSDKTVKISDGSLHIENGDKVIWNVQFVDERGNPITDSKITPVIKFSGRVVKEEIRGTKGGGEIRHDILKDKVLGNQRTEPYSVILLNDDEELESLRPLTYVSSKSFRDTTPEPFLVIDHIGDPPPEKLDPREHRWGHRRARRNAK